MDGITEHEFRALGDLVWNRYRSSGRPKAVLEALWHHNQGVLERVDDLAEGESLNSADYQTLKAAAILHDAASADVPAADHARASAELAVAALGEMRKKQDLIHPVGLAILRHMGASAFFEPERPEVPAAWIEQLLYDADTLALLDPARLPEFVVTRTITPAWAAEDEREAAERGIDAALIAEEAALDRFRRAAASVHSETACRIAATLLEKASRSVRAPTLR